jgi:hypothetical protein
VLTLDVDVVVNTFCAKSRLQRARRTLGILIVKGSGLSGTNGICLAICGLPSDPRPTRIESLGAPRSKAYFQKTTQDGMTVPR